MAKENKFQADLIKKIERYLPGSIVLKNDPNYLQGVPDLIVIHNDQWAMLEVKASCHARVQPNQDYYVDMFANMGFSRFIYPENEAEVLLELVEYFRIKNNAIR